MTKNDKNALKLKKTDKLISQFLLLVHTVVSSRSDLDQVMASGSVLAKKDLKMHF